MCLKYITYSKVIPAIYFFADWPPYFLGISTGMVHDYEINSGYRISVLRPIGRSRDPDSLI